MPIRPENLARYPANWAEISARIRRDRARNKCEQCGVDNHALGGRLPNGTFVAAWPLGESLHGLKWPEPGDMGKCGTGQILRIIRIVLTVAHLDHTPENCADDNLRAWCQRCHLAYDLKHHRATIHARQFAAAAVADLFA